ncbi:MAG: hypothetical protein ACRCUY_12085 [Thermoguttaceae bacterium]
MEEKSQMRVMDIPLSRLIPTNTRKFTEKELIKTRKSIEAIGMVEPFCVSEDGDSFLIDDGNKRYFILLDAGVESAPCVVVVRPDTYTASYQVIDVSPMMRKKMIDKVLETVPAEKIAAAIGLESLRPSLDKKLVEKLNPAVVLAYEQGLITKAGLSEFKKVIPKRQAEILKELKHTKQFGISVIQGLILVTPESERVAQGNESPWLKRDRSLDSITKGLQEVEQRSATMTQLYHTYVSDVTKQLVYVRSILRDKKAAAYLEKTYPEILKMFREIMERE